MLNHSTRRRLQIVAIVFAIATCFGLLISTQIYLLYARAGGASFGKVALSQMPAWYIWATFVPLVMYAARMFPLRPRIVQALPGHLAALSGLVAIRAAIEATIATTPGLTAVDNRWIDAVIQLGFGKMWMDIMAYGTILATTHALDYYSRFRERERVAAELSVQLDLARLHALRMQLNPHFLFNAMNSVSMLVRERDHERAVDLIAGISDLLRYVLDETLGSEVPLREELGFAERYLDIERVRFSDRLDIAVDASADTAGVLVPNLILQPLVENAIRHGIAPQARAGMVRVSARALGDELVLEVRDSGRGPKDGEPGRTAGIGLKNTRARLEQLHGEAQRFELVRESGETVARIALPLRYSSHPSHAGASRT